MNVCKVQPPKMFWLILDFSTRDSQSIHDRRGAAVLKNDAATAMCCGVDHHRTGAHMDINSIAALTRLAIEDIHNHARFHRSVRSRLVRR